MGYTLAQHVHIWQVYVQTFGETAIVKGRRMRSPCQNSKDSGEETVFSSAVCVSRTPCA
jgi:hypothetical protein